MKIYPNVLIGLLVILSLFHSCKNDIMPEPEDYPFLILEEVSNISSDGATFIVEVTSLGTPTIKAYGIVWDELENPTINKNSFKLYEGQPTIGRLECNVNNDLEKDKQFFVRAFVKSEKYIVYSNPLSFISAGCLPPQIDTFSPDSGTVTKVITITGKNFSLNADNNMVYFDDTKAQIVRTGVDTIWVLCPTTKETKNVTISVEVAGMIDVASSSFKLIYPWERLNDFAGGGRTFSASTIDDSKGYICMGFANPDYEYSLNSLWQFSYNSNQWKQLRDFPGKERSHGTAFNYNGILYFGLGFIRETVKGGNDLWAYNPDNDQWVQKSSCPESNAIFNVNFVLGDTAFFYSPDLENVIYKYFIKKDSWERDIFNSHIEEPLCGFNYDGKGYLITYKGKIWQYDPLKKDFVFYDNMGVKSPILYAFVLDKTVYGIGNTMDQLYSYNMVNAYRQVIDTPFGNALFINSIFSIKDRVFISPGFSKEFWTFYPH